MHKLNSNPISASEIERVLLERGFNYPYCLKVLNEIDSTNTYLKNQEQEKPFAICCAEVQTQGRGRFGRHWHSPYGENIYLSVRLDLGADLSKLSGLSLVTSLAIVKTIQEFQPNDSIKVKWPNDLIWNDKKLCGCLIEILPTNSLIIGIGLNVNSDTKSNPLPDRDWCSLFEIFGAYFDRNQLIAALILQLQRYIEAFMDNDLTYFLDQWQAHDYLLGKSVAVAQASKTVNGIVQGISPEGQLIILDSSYTTHYFTSGEASILVGQNKRY